MTAFLGLKEDFSKNIDNWKSSRRNDPLKELVINGSAQYLAQIDIEQFVNVTKIYTLAVQYWDSVVVQEIDGAIIILVPIFCLTVLLVIFCLLSKRNAPKAD